MWRVYFIVTERLQNSHRYSLKQGSNPNKDVLTAGLKTYLRQPGTNLEPSDL